MQAGDRVPSIKLSDQAIRLSGLKTAVAASPTRPRTLQLRGNLALDVNRLVHVHARFPGLIVHLETIEESAPGSPGAPKVRRTLNFMDRVSKGQVLGQIWSKDLGEKKSEMVDALVRLKIDQQNLTYLEKLSKDGATPERSVREARRLVEVGEIAVSKAERTLRSWALSDAEIRRVRDEADLIHRDQTYEVPSDEDWASVQVVSPIDGTIVEKNVVEGDLVNADSDLFKIADLSVLSAWARIYEEDIPLLHAMPKPITWKLKLSATENFEPITGTIDRIGEIIDPNEHMALLAGMVQNPGDQLHAGQFITAVIDLPPEKDVVEIPTRALVEDGEEATVFVQVDAQDHRFQLRRVAVVRRTADLVYVRSRLTDDQRQRVPAGGRPLEELHEGDVVLAAGALELKAAWQEQNGQ
ncbi:MAG: efflux RND transporter periplasmic adaptor subunit [Planctomycetes bacterium]|nr:efflux RND transporter periplasmic adaptor subunit [Planctomycetota bacterium]